MTTRGRRPSSSTRARPSARGKRKRADAAPAPLTATVARAVLVAADARQPAAAAIELACHMADRGAWAPEIVTVCEPLPVAVGPLALPEMPLQEHVAMTDSLLAQIKRQMRLHGAGAWKLSIRYGRVSREIVRSASELNSALIVLGLGHHTAAARLLGAETAARVARHADVPVLAVHPDTRVLPHLAVVAMDFGDSSTNAAREALALLEPPGRLHLVHVQWGYNTTSLRDSEWARAYRMGVEHGFDRLRVELAPPPGIEITSELVQGGVVDAFLDIANRMGAGLVALGSHSQTVIDRLIIGSTPTEVLRTARCSVLIAPPTPRT